MACVPLEFLVVPNFHLCFYSSIATDMFFLFLSYSIGLYTGTILVNIASFSNCNEILYTNQYYFTLE